MAVASFILGIIGTVTGIGALTWEMRYCSPPNRL